MPIVTEGFDLNDFLLDVSPIFLQQVQVVTERFVSNLLVKVQNYLRSRVLSPQPPSTQITKNKSSNTVNDGTKYDAAKIE